MTGSELKRARKECLKVSQAELAALMETPKRTIQDIEARGDQPVRGCYKRLLELLIWRDRVIMQAIIEKVDRDIARDFPNGIKSEVDEE